MPMCPYPFLRLIVGAGSVSLLLAGCLPQGSDETLDPAAGDEIGGGPVVVQAGADLLKPISGDVHETPTQFSEAPALSDLVRLGTLPPVEARLPRNPGIIAPLQEIGRYGGTLRRVLTDDTIQATGIAKTLGENLMTYHRPITNGIECDLAESFELSQDGKSAVFVDPLSTPHVWGIGGSKTPFWHRNAATLGPAWLLEVSQLLQKALTTTDPDQHNELMAQANDLFSENVPIIVLAATYHPWASNRRLGNVPEHLSPYNSAPTIMYWAGVVQSFTNRII